jgi:hypothetical protein
MICELKRFNPRSGSASAILMARIVDSDGTCIKRPDVKSIRFSLYEVDLSWPELLTAVRGRIGMALTVADVMSDVLQTNAPWKIDDIGYNFHHEIVLDGEYTMPKVARYEAQYEFESLAGLKSIIRFQLRC